MTKHPAWHAFIRLIVTTFLALTPATLLWLTVGYSRFDLFLVAKSSSARMDSFLRELFRWSVVLSIGCFSYYATLMIVHLLPTSLSKVYHLTHHQFRPSTDMLEPFGHGLKQILGLRRYMAMAVSLFCMSTVLYVLVVPDAPAAQTATTTDKQIEAAVAAAGNVGWQLIAARCFRAAFVIALAVLLEKACIQHIAAYFHSQHYRERVERNNFAMHALHQLKKALHIRVGTNFKAKPKDRRVSLIRASGAKEAIRRDSIYTGGLDKQLGTDTDGNLTTLSTESIAVMANAMFDAMAGPARENLVFENFVGLLPKGDDAPRFFAFLDTDANGDISRKEWLEGITKRIFDEREMIIASLTANSAVIQRIDRLMLVVALLLSVFYWLPIFDASLLQSITAIVSTALTLSFLFESFVGGTVVSILFLLLTHPFDVGDVIVVEGVWYTIVDINLMESVLCGPTNQLTYVSNTWLAECAISNHRRSVNISETITLPVDTHVSSSQILHLEKLIQQYTMEHDREFLGGTDVHIAGIKIISADIMNVEVEFKYKGSLNEGPSKDVRLVGLMRFIKEQAIVQAGIRLAPVNWDL